MQTHAPVSQPSTSARQTPSGVIPAGGFADLLAALSSAAGNGVPAQLRPGHASSASQPAAGGMSPATEAEDPAAPGPGVDLLALLTPSSQPGALLVPPQPLPVPPQPPTNGAGAAVSRSAAIPAAAVVTAAAAESPAERAGFVAVQPGGQDGIVPPPAAAATDTAATPAVATEPVAATATQSPAHAVASAALAAAAKPEAAADQVPDAAVPSLPDVERRPGGRSERGRPAVRALPATAAGGAEPAPVAVVSAPAAASRTAGVAASVEPRLAPGIERAAEAVAAPTASDASGDPGLPQAIVDPALALPGMDDGVSLAAPASSTAPAAAAAPAVQIAMQLARGVGGNTLVVSLSPEELGGVEIKLELDEDGRSRARIVVERPATLELIQRDAPMLERALQAAGLDLAPNALSFDLRQDGQAPPQRREPSATAGPTPSRRADAAPPAEPSLPVSRLLDLRV